MLTTNRKTQCAAPIGALLALLVASWALPGDGDGKMSAVIVGFVSGHHRVTLATEVAAIVHANPRVSKPTPAEEIVAQPIFPASDLNDTPRIWFGLGPHENSTPSPARRFKHRFVSLLVPESLVIPPPAPPPRLAA
jgi:hypothetical protein